jgi:hypothetical protein
MDEKWTCSQLVSFLPVPASTVAVRGQEKTSTRVVVGLGVVHMPTRRCIGIEGWNQWREKVWWLLGIRIQTLAVSDLAALVLNAGKGIVLSRCVELYEYAVVWWRGEVFIKAFEVRRLNRSFAVDLNCIFLLPFWRVKRLRSRYFAANDRVALMIRVLSLAPLVRTWIGTSILGCSSHDEECL